MRRDGRVTSRRRERQTDAHIKFVRRHTAVGRNLLPLLGQRIASVEHRARLSNIFTYLLTYREDSINLWAKGGTN